MLHTLPSKEYLGKKVVATSKTKQNKTMHDKNNSNNYSVSALCQDLDTDQ